MPDSPHIDLPAPSQRDLLRWMPPATSLADRDPGLGPDRAAAWHGTVWSRLGRGDLAWAWWDSTDPDGPLGAWVAAERGRVLRELGLHVRAQELELAGLEKATDLVDVVTLRLSLAADAVGRGDVDRARWRWETASELLDELPATGRTARQRLRRAWVAVEVALLAGTEPPTDLLPDLGQDGEVVQPAETEHGTDFHRSKGLLFAASARRRPELLPYAARLAPGALRWAIELARLDAGDPEAASRAVGAWHAVVPPPHVAREVAATPTARRLAALTG